MKNTPVLTLHISNGAIRVLQDLKIRQQVIHRHFHNVEWKKFLDGLPTDHDRRVAGMTMDWIKATYSQLEDTLNGELVWSEINGKLKEK